MNIKNFRIIKLDRRMNGHETFSHKVVPVGLVDFLKMREWLWSNYGPGSEWQYVKMSSRNPEFETEYKWGWESNHGHRRYYVSEEILTHFILAFSI